MSLPLYRMCLWPLKRGRKLLAFALVYLAVSILYFFVIGWSDSSALETFPLDNQNFLQRDLDARDTLVNALSLVSCSNSQSFNNDTLRRQFRQYLTESAIINRTRNCNSYFKIIQTLAFEDITPEERDYPIAYGHLINGQVGTFELYLAVHFRPWDTHCIHVDPKANEATHQAIEGLVRCYREKFKGTSFFIAKHPVPVIWQDESVLRADLICLQQSIHKNEHWKMYLNLASSELPLMSHQEFRKQLAQANTNVIDVGPNENSERQTRLMGIRRGGPDETNLEREWMGENPYAPPCNIMIMKGYKNAALTREFASFVLNHRVSLEYFNWLKNTECPDEHYYSTLATLEVESEVNQTQDKPHKLTLKQNLKDDGPFSDKTCYRKFEWIGGWAQKKSEEPDGPEEDRTVFLDRCNLVEDTCQDVKYIYSPPSAPDDEVHNWLGHNWLGQVCLRKSLWYYPECKGRQIRRMCHFGVEDLDLVRKGNCLFGNKFNINVDVAAIMCQIKELRTKANEVDPSLSH
ncbi:beta-1,3-galactosyl-O-glycosyl-glycoprotein beta-1,6-N-acetylglucosaminyltransferase-like [Tigriopus californicus]|uniref:beta-1,3-galactosyl-O-glycosyl-glycoprotein beta-1,6-N-acetylglucosaminyltransferase-like n=1 Tax=Tigriopus californicus TaxID=6832 RepID=UPI0027DA03A6|nr:beta-1,3-galactosyl-O-glycosyl-glycoprotein beta-1,6-N-acetylglucosaminyltransferase-like [Tigriopus californicus]